jgi:L-threonylcarbamoyladenylate synthase
VTPIVADGPAGRAEAVRRLRAGGIVAIPTDTVYGLAVALATPDGPARLFAAKGRPADRAIAVLLADMDQAAELGRLTPAGRALAGAFWPGALTLVLERNPARVLPDALTGGRPTIGLRVPDHPAPRAIAAELGPLPTTSANRSGEPEALDAAAIAAALGDRIDMILDGGPAPGARPSTVVDVSGPEPRILRVGAIEPAAIESVVRDMGR